MEHTLNILSRLASHPDLPIILNGTRQYPDVSDTQYLSSISQRVEEAVRAIEVFCTSRLVYKTGTTGATVTEMELDERTEDNYQYFNCLKILKQLKEEASHSRNLCKDDVNELVEGLDQATFLLDHKRKAEFEARVTLPTSKELHVVVTGVLNYTRPLII